LPKIIPRCDRKDTMSIRIKRKYIDKLKEIKDYNPKLEKKVEELIKEEGRWDFDK